MTEDSKLLEAENAFLEKEVSTYKKESQNDVKRLHDQVRSLLTENTRLSSAWKSSEDKCALFLKEKMHAESEFHLARNKLKDAQVACDKIEREAEKEKKRFASAEMAMNDKLKELTKEKIALQNQNAVLSNKIKELNAQLGKLERLREKPESPMKAQSLLAKKVADKSLVSKLRETEKQLKEASRATEQLEELLDEANEAIEDLEKENGLLEMQIERLKGSHSYACELEEKLAEMEQISEHAKYLEQKNTRLEKLLRSDSKSITTLGQEVQELSERLVEINAREE